MDAQMDAPASNGIHKQPPTNPPKITVPVAKTAGSTGIVFITPAERARLIAARAHQLDRGAEVMLEMPANERAALGSLEVATREVYARVAPIGVVRRDQHGEETIIGITNAVFLA